MVVNASSAASSQSVDRLVGTAAIIGLSLALAFQWITGNDDGDDNYEQEEIDQYHDCYNHEPIAIARTKATAAATTSGSPSSRTKSTHNTEVNPSSSSSSWWWPITLMTRRRKKKRRKRHCNNNSNNSNRRNTDMNHDNFGNNNSFDHLGSCECGSIQFIVSIYVKWASQFCCNFFPPLTTTL